MHIFIPFFLAYKKKVKKETNYEKKHFIRKEIGKTKIRNVLSKHPKTQLVAQFE